MLFILGIIHVCCEPMKQDKLYNFKIQFWDKNKIDIPIPKGRICKEAKSEGFQVSPKPNKENSLRP
jgi:hypothetical protein